VQTTLACGPEDLRGDARFADVGGDSLSTLKISKLLEEIFDTEVPVGVVIDPTSDLYLLANYIEKNRNNGRKRPTSASVPGRNESEARERPDAGQVHRRRDANRRHDTGTPERCRADGAANRRDRLPRSIPVHGMATAP